MIAEDPKAIAASKPESLVGLLGGRRGALDATFPVIGYIAGWLFSAGSIGWGATAALVAAAAVAWWRLRRGDKPRAVLIGALVVCASALVALYTGRAEDFFLIQIFSNAASALAWALSIVLRWPLLGLVVGTVLGQKARWRRDPALLRAYATASWVWVGQYLVRLAVFLPLWVAGAVAALGAARIVLSWPLVVVCLTVSGVVLRWSLPKGHPGLRHPELDDHEVTATEPRRSWPWDHDRREKRETNPEREKREKNPEREKGDG